MLEYEVQENGDYQLYDGNLQDGSWILELPEDVDDVDEYIVEQITAVDLGNSCEQRTRG